MSGKLKIAFGINIIIALIGAIAGSAYIFANEITSYHKIAIGVEWNSVAPGVQQLLVVLMKGTGLSLLLMAMSVLILSFIPFRRGENWSRGAILFIGLGCWVPMFVGALYVLKTTGAPSPWWLNAILMMGLIISYFLSGELKKNK